MKYQKTVICECKRVPCVGEEVTLVESYNVNGGKSHWRICFDPEGVPGNSNPSIKRHHGWRGTTNNIAVYALGRRKIKRVTVTGEEYGGFTCKVTLGPDLDPNED